MRRGVVAWIGLGLLVVLFGVQGISSYNGLVRTQSRVRHEWAAVDTLLQARSALIEPALRSLENLPGSRPELLATVATTRDQLATAVTRQERITAAREMDAALSQLLVAVESDSIWYHDDDVRQFQEELARTERRLSVERTTYNELVFMFNRMLQRFPTNLFANMLGFKQGPMYREAPAAVEIPRRSREQQPRG
jgi:LemA protein